MFKLIVNGSVMSTLNSLESLKRIGFNIKQVYKDAIVSIEDKQGYNIHYFF